MARTRCRSATSDAARVRARSGSAGNGAQCFGRRRNHESQPTLPHARTLDRRRRGTCSARWPRLDGSRRSRRSDRPCRCAAQRHAWRQRCAAAVASARCPSRRPGRDSRQRIRARRKRRRCECDAGIVQSIELRGLIMKRIVLIAGSAFAVQGVALQSATAADAARAANTAQAAAESSADASAQAAKADQARKELAELRGQMQELSRKMAELSSQLGEGNPRSYAMRYLGNPDHALIGVVLDRDEKGVRLSGVSPDGPAARAGLREGDVLTTIDQQSLTASKPAESLAKARTLLANLKDGQDVSIDFLRGTQKGTVKFAAEHREAWNWPLMMNEDAEHPFMPKDFNERVHAQVERATREAERVAERDTAHMQAEVERATREAMKHVPRDRMRMVMPW